ncbi:MAG TPA: MBG domain-containing protein, partial [Burkholderiales bacterium]|nr:MBG domain-containing protein [Burkholderiales bacterium]
VTITNRAGGENVGSYAINTATFNALGGSSAGNYSGVVNLATPASTLTITQAPLSARLANPNETKIYGNNDPVLNTIGVTLNGLINRTVSTWNGNVVVNDSALTSTVTSLSRAVGENVGSYPVTAGSFTAASANYSLPVFDGSNNPALSITQALGLTATIANQTKVYGSSDPLAATIPVILSGQVNASVTDWNGNVTVINDTTAGKLSATLLSITRNAGENVGSYNYTSGVLNPLGGSSAGNYASASFNPGSSVLDITPASLTVKADNESKPVGNTFVFTGSEFTATGLQFGETIGSVTLTSAGAPAPAPAGTYPIVPSAATGGTFSAGNYNISYVNGVMTVTSVTPPLPLFPSPNFLGPLFNPIIIGLQSLGIDVPRIVYEALNCIGHSLDAGAIVNNGVAVSLPRRCVTDPGTSQIYDFPKQTIRYLIIGESAGEGDRSDDPNISPTASAFLDFSKLTNRGAEQTNSPQWTQLSPVHPVLQTDALPRERLSAPFRI